MAPARKDINKDFALRGFLICETCGYRLTACWTRSQTGQKHPYYLCQHRGCSEKGKSIKRGELEREFEELLQTLVPTHNTFELAEEVFRTAWLERSSSVSKESKRLSSKSRQIERDIDNLVERVVQSKISRVTSTYETRIAELEQEKALIEEEIAKIATPDHSFEEMFELSMRFLANPYEIWEKGDLEVKKTVQRLVFTQPLTVSRKTGVQTGKTTFPFKALHFLKGTKFEMVPHTATNNTPSHCFQRLYIDAFLECVGNCVVE